MAHKGGFSAQLSALAFIGALLMSVPVLAVHSESRVVTIDAGRLRGTTTDTGRQFLGIPYAAPPVGELRWAPPAPVARWRDIRDASQFGDNCAQVPTPFGLESVSEDCLFLNVYTPPPMSGLRRDPVMVWIHPGAFQFGEGDDYDPRKLVERGVVVITLNYRLGVLGFLAHPALSAVSSSGASGNYGLMDQQAALRWVRRNIARFGGDPDNVTIFGESAGGLSVHAHLASPGSRGLFDQAIAQSAAYSLVQPSLAAAEAEGISFANAVGCAEQDLACLRAVPVPVVLANHRPGPLGFLPNVDGDVLPRSIGEAFATGRFNRVPVIEGSTHDEFRLFIPLSFDFLSGPVAPEQYPGAIAALLGLPAAAVAPILERYPLSDYESPGTALGAIGTDAVFACNAHTAIQHLSRYVRTYAYEFNDTTAPQRYLPPASFAYGAYHESELQYLFDLVTNLPAVALNEPQERLSRSMVRYWTHFAYFANPNSFSTPLWVRQSARSDFVQRLESSGPQPYSAPQFAADHKCDLWASAPDGQ